jgi:aminopeptidase YwaD
MPNQALIASAEKHLRALCAVAPDRRPGSAGNRAATDYVAQQLSRAGWPVERQDFSCLGWSTDGGFVDIGQTTVELAPSPYGLGVTAAGPLRVLGRVADLGRDDLTDAIVVLTGELTAEPLTPKGYPFYQSEDHQRIVAALEAARPAAVIAVTGRFPALCGALDPFPLIEDGDFRVPTSDVGPDAAAPLLVAEGAMATIELRSERRPAHACNVLTRSGPSSGRVTVMAHIDTKPGTPGAVDNAAGVVVLLLLAGLLSPTRHGHLPVGVELLAVNGEDHYAAPGEVAWLAAQVDGLDDIALAINIDGAGYHDGRSAYSTYNVDGDLGAHIDAVMARHDDLVRGPAWYQSDHGIFAMRGRPAVAITSEHLDEMLTNVYHSPADTPDEADARHIVSIAVALRELLAQWPNGSPS